MPRDSSALETGFEIIGSAMGIPQAQALKELDEEDKEAQQWWESISKGKPVPNHDDWKDWLDDLKDKADAFKDGAAGINKYNWAKGATERRKHYLLERHPERWPAIRWKEQVEARMKKPGMAGQNKGSGTAPNAAIGMEIQGHGHPMSDQMRLPHEPLKSAGAQNEAAPHKNVNSQIQVASPMYPAQPMHQQGHMPTQNVPTGNTNRADAILATKHQFPKENHNATEDGAATKHHFPNPT